MKIKVLPIFVIISGYILFLICDSNMYLLISIIGLLGLCYLDWKRIRHNRDSNYLDYKMMILYVVLIINFLFLIFYGSD